ncbi:MAG TPA: coenzyme F420-0:L-glutamate ligase [Candidatus Moranbacteria bacterium]|nr:coenzyme F420-0:L-glutamate ligase [Candidatus Moranbacteria bacterium]
MKILPIKTRKIRAGEENIYSVISRHIRNIKENSILVITSKIVSICEGRVVKIGKIKKKELVEREADLYLPPQKDRFHVTLTVKNNILCSSSGVDESNGDGFWVLWPENPQKSANNIRKYLAKKYKLKNVGVIITDSKSNILRRGASGIAIAHSGFLSLKSYVGKKDIFGRKMKVTKANVVDSLAISAVLVMGEGAEQTPLAIISNLDFIKFKKNNPTKKELAELQVDMDNDYFKVLLKSVEWKKGGKK